MKDNTLFEKFIETFHSNIGISSCGKRIKTKNHVYGPEIRSHFLIVFVEKGSAVLYGKEKETLFGERDILVMFPGEKIFYKAQTEWTIKWIGVFGNQIEDIFNVVGVTRKNPILKSDNFDIMLKIVQELFELENDGSIFVKYKMQSLLHEFFAVMLEVSDKRISFDPINSALDIIEYNYNKELNIKHISESVFLDSAYFSRLFKSRVGIPPKKYILNTRLEKAKELLIKTNYPIKEISAIVGYSDSLYFSKLFLKNEKISPLEYRKRNKNNSQLN